jgi:hypothetical protein
MYIITKKNQNKKFFSCKAESRNEAFSQKNTLFPYETQFQIQTKSQLITNPYSNQYVH